MKPPDETARAADLWERLVTAWESSDGDDGHQDQDPFLNAVGELVAEWQGFRPGPVGREIQAAPAIPDRCVLELVEIVVAWAERARRNEGETELRLTYTPRRQPSSGFYAEELRCTEARYSMEVP